MDKTRVLSKFYHFDFLEGMYKEDLHQTFKMGLFVSYFFSVFVGICDAQHTGTDYLGH